MNQAEVKKILLLYRPDTADAADPAVAEALALAAQDAELSRWLAAHCARQEALRVKFRQIAPPAGLKEQILSERSAQARRITRRRAMELTAVAAIMLCAGLWLLRRPAPVAEFAAYRSRMASTALRNYGMDLETKDPAQIRAFLARQQAPSDYTLPAGLQKAVVTGCAVEKWQGAKVTMVCFRTSRPLPPGAQSDLWLFVIERSKVDNAPEASVPVLAKVNRLMTATWTQGDKLYLLGVAGDEQTLRSYL